MRSARFRFITLLGASLAAAVIAVPAIAQDADAPAAPAPKRAKRKPVAAKVINVQVLNQRDTTLVELTVLGNGRNAQAITIASQIGPGGKMTTKVPANQGCVFAVNGSFDDESTVEVPQVNLCKDPRITLVE
jgi:hypothetical protein